MIDKKTIYLHIGFEKTGTKSIQKFCSTHSSKLQTEGILYLNDIHNGLVFASTHWPIAAAFCSQKCVPPSKQISPSEISTLVSETVKNTSCRKIVFSAEPFSSMFNSVEQISHLKKTLADFEVKIIAYVRRQDHFFISLISSHVKGGNTFTLSDKVSLSETEIGYASQSRYNYLQKLSQWENVFGIENLIVRPFEKESLEKGDIICDFLKVLDVNANLFSESLTRENESLSIEALLFLNQINKKNVAPRLAISYIRNVVVPYLQKYASKRQTGQQLISNSHRQEIINMYEASNNEVATRYMQNRAKLFIAALPDVDEEWTPVQPISHSELINIVNFLENTAVGTSAKIISILSGVPEESLP